MLGLVVNPVAGIGGPAGLAGSDGADVQSLALARGSSARAGSRATIALASLPPGTPVLTAAGPMGADAATAAGLDPRVVYTPVSIPASLTSSPKHWPVTRHAGAEASTPGVPRHRAVFSHPDMEGQDTTGSAETVADAATRCRRETITPADTTAADTTAAVRALVAAGATLVLFAGGDGTARDVAAGIGETPEVAALGIPAGVKMYSPVFAVSPRAAGALAAAWLDGGLPVEQREVLDVDEAALRRARVEPLLFGTMLVPYRAGRTQARKAATPASDHAAIVAAARGAASTLRPGVRYLLGPGGTMAELARALGVEKTPLGVDVVLDGRIVRRGASEPELLDEIGRGPAKAVVSVIGGQGFLLGRGNQQLSARVVRALGPDPLVVVAPESKLIELQGRPLLVDTGDPVTDAAIAGFVRVVTGPSASSFYPVHAPELTPEPTEEPHAS